ncbi:quinone oxidoreductase family protein [Cryobacterium sp. AP23]
MNTAMQVYLVGKGTPFRLGERPVPVPGHDQLLVRTRAVALNNADLTPAGEDHIAGYEFSGEVVELGVGVDASRRGQRVAGTTVGAFAEFVLVHQRHVLPIPDGLSFADAAALPTALLTEYGALALAGVGAGDAVLITAASSGIGLIGVQIARLFGATPVIATTRSPRKRALLESVGADVVIATSEDDLVGAVLEATGGTGVAVVLDHVAGGMIAAAVPATRTGGQIVSVGRLSGAEATVDLYALAARAVTIRSVSYGFTPPSTIGDLLDAVAARVLPAVADGRIRAVVDRVLPFAQAQAGLDRLRSGEAEGKIVLTMP